MIELGQLQTLFTTILNHIQTCAAAGETKQQLVEEYVDCLLRMTKAFKNNGTGHTSGLGELCKGLASHCEPAISEILAARTTKFPGLSKKAVFALMDSLDIFRTTLNL